MSQSNDINPNRAPWTSAGGTPRSDTSGAARPYAPRDSIDGNGPPLKRGLGCWVWGCLGSIVFMLLLVVGLGFATYYYVTNQVAKYTDTQPAEMPIVEMEAEELDALEKRIESFTNQVRGKSEAGSDVLTPLASEETPSEESSREPNTDAVPDLGAKAAPTVRELVLTADEINALIASKPDLRGRIFVEINEGNVSGKVSFPTDIVPGGAGRFFNADAEFDVSMQDGILVVRLLDASVKGERVPQEILDAFARENLAKDVYNDPDNAEMLRKFDSIEVVDDSIVLRLKEPKPETETEQVPEQSPETDESDPGTATEQPVSDSV